MNSLSWFLYLADILPRVGLLTALLAILLLGVAFVMPPKGATMFGEGHNGPFEGMARLKTPFILWLCFLVFAFLVPSKDTIYLIAASEAGEMVVNTPEAKEIMSDLKEILNIQLDKLKE